MFKGKNILFVIWTFVMRYLLGNLSKIVQTSFKKILYNIFELVV